MIPVRIDTKSVPRISPVTGRRQLIAGLSALCATFASGCIPKTAGKTDRLIAGLRIIEASGNGTLGVALHNTQSGETLSYKGFARFPHCSTFKLSLAAQILYLDQTGALDKAEKLHWTQADLLSHSPYTKTRLSQGATLAELAEHAQRGSDNTAANLLLDRIGGPAAITQFWRILGDQTSRLDRMEPQLNNVPIGEILDTTTPDAMALTISRLLYGDMLSAENSARLKRWMVDTKTGVQRVRAGLPQGWVAGDKTGTSLWPGMRSVYADIGFIESPDHPPLTFATYFRANGQHARIEPAAQKVLADVGKLAARMV